MFLTPGRVSKREQHTGECATVVQCSSARQQCSARNCLEERLDRFEQAFQTLTVYCKRPRVVGASAEEDSKPVYGVARSLSKQFKLPDNKNGDGDRDGDGDDQVGTELNSEPKLLLESQTRSKIKAAVRVMVW